MKAAFRTLWTLAWVMGFALAVNRTRSPSRELASIEDLFAGSIPQVEIVLDPEAVQSLREHGRTKVDARVHWNGASASSAKLRLKGHATYQTFDQKPSLTLSYADEPLPGLQKIHLNNSAEDATYVQEQLGSELFRASGIPAPRVGQARVKLNGRDLGLYTLKEGFSPAFLARHFKSAGGSITEGEVSSASTLRAAAAEPDLGTRWTKLGALLDLENFLSFIATEVLICHWDGYATSANNVRIFQHPGTGRFDFLPSGMDQIFGNPAYPSSPDMAGVVARAVMEIPEGREQFRRRLKTLAANFDGKSWADRTTRIASRLRPELSRAENQELSDNLKELNGRILARDLYLKHEWVQVASRRD